MKSHWTPLTLIAGLFATIVTLTDMFPYAIHGRGDQLRLVVLGFLLGAMLISLIDGLPAITRTVAQHVSMWLATLFGLLIAYSYRDEVPELYERFRANISPSVAVAISEDAVELRRGWDGHYHAFAEVNGGEVAFLFDTGASMVVLRYEDAEKIGLPIQDLEFNTPAITANGRSYVAPVTLDLIKLGSVQFRHVDAFVTQPDKMSQSLLGMNVLNRLEEMTFKGNRVILRQ